MNTGSEASPKPEGSPKPGDMITITADPTAPSATSPLPKRRNAGIHSGRLRLPPRIPARSFSTQDSHHPWYRSGEDVRFVYNPQFSDDTAACIVISDAIFVMLGTHAKFREFTPKAVCDTSQAVEVLISLSCESREQVDELVAKALAAGGSTYDKPEDFGFMYTHSFVDLDGHGWGLLHMVPQPEPQ